MPLRRETQNGQDVDMKESNKYINLLAKPSLIKCHDHVSWADIDPPLTLNKTCSCRFGMWYTPGENSFTITSLCEVECPCVPQWMAIVFKLSKRSQILEGVCAPESRIVRGCREGNTACLFFPFLHFSWDMNRVCTSHVWLLLCLQSLSQRVSESGVWSLLGRAIITRLWRKPKKQKHPHGRSCHWWTKGNEKEEAVSVCVCL